MLTDIKKLHSHVLYALSGISMLVFALFWLVGFDRPYEDDGNFNAPLFTDLLLVLMLLIAVGTVAVAIWSAIRSARICGSGDKVVNNVPVRRIGMWVSISTVVLLLLTFTLSSSAPMRINGLSYVDQFWLKASGMFVSTSIVMIGAAIAAVAYGSTKYVRKP